MHEFTNHQGDPETAEQVLDAYELLLQRGGLMLDRVRDQDWDLVVDEGVRYVVEVERLSRCEKHVSFSDEQQARKAGLLEDILQRDVEVTRQLATRREELSAMLGYAQRQRRLQEVYGSGGSVVEASVRFEPGRP